MLLFLKKKKKSSLTQMGVHVSCYVINQYEANVNLMTPLYWKYLSFNEFKSVLSLSYTLCTCDESLSNILSFNVVIFKFEFVYY